MNQTIIYQSYHFLISNLSCSNMIYCDLCIYNYCWICPMISDFNWCLENENLDNDHIPVIIIGVLQNLTWIRYYLCLYTCYICIYNEDNDTINLVAKFTQIIFHMQWLVYVIVLNMWYIKAENNHGWPKMM